MHMVKAAAAPTKGAVMCAAEKELGCNVLATEKRGCCRMSESSQLGERQERGEPEWGGPQQ